MTADERASIPVTLITGANRGIGFEVCRQLAREGMKVFLGARGPEKAESATHELPREGLDVVPRTVNVSKDQSVGGLADKLEEFGRLDVPLDNAGINFDFRQWTSNANLGMAHETMKTNLFGACRSSTRASTVGSSTSRARLAPPSLSREVWRVWREYSLSTRSLKQRSTRSP